MHWTKQDDNPMYPREPVIKHGRKERNGYLSGLSITDYKKICTMHSRGDNTHHIIITLKIDGELVHDAIEFYKEYLKMKNQQGSDAAGT
jgi:hypothetical protein